MIPLFKPEFNEEMKDAAIKALESEFFVLGESVYKFEEEFAKYIGTKYAISVSSGTDALELSLRAFEIEEGKSVITPSHTFIATANSITMTGARPHFVDVNLHDCNIDVNSIKFNGESAILPVHLYGNPCNMEELTKISHENSMVLIEDSCQAHGAEYKGKKTGSIGDAGCFSFYSTKNMTVGGDGGMVTTNNEEARDKIVSMRDCGRIKGKRYLHDVVGFTKRLNTVNAAIGRVQLRNLDRWNNSRCEIASVYDKLLSEEIRFSKTPRSKPVYHIYAIKLQDREIVSKHLKSKSIATGIHYPIPIHKQIAYSQYSDTTLKNTEILASSVLSIPIFPSMKKDDAKTVAESINEVI